MKSRNFQGALNTNGKKNVNVIGINEFDTFGLSGGQIEFERC